MNKSIFVWNCQGAASNSFHRMLKSLLQGYRPEIIVLVEPRISGIKANKVIKKLGYPHSHRVEASGFSGGIWLMRSTNVLVSVLNNHQQFIHTSISDSTGGSKALFTAVYASPNPSMRETLWADLINLERDDNATWLLAGDFNATIAHDERKGGSKLNQSGCKKFHHFSQRLGLLDLGYIGPRFTWQRGNLMVRLDRALCNEKWLMEQPTTHVLHLPKAQSDHRPLLIKAKNGGSRNNPTFCFLASWILHPDFHNLVSNSWASNKCLSENISLFVEKAQHWNRETYGQVG
ncbi:uncharacterized protein LOC114756265 [Neltuma alba]|uniref:uncharacterized protein LOC114756265 n=1 Tax=Neltuma alba TaxID=207710 RepID=UPI0010A4C704|nr:uncharacterized protein LOC114756265 [Prosopis alba]